MVKFEPPENQPKLVQSYLMTAVKKRLVTKTEVINTATALKATAAKLEKKTVRVQRSDLKDEQPLVTKKSINKQPAPIIKNKQPGSIAKPTDSATLAQRLRARLKQQLRQAPTLNRSHENSLSLMVPKSAVSVEHRTNKSAEPKINKSIQDLEPGGANQIYGERLTVVNGVCYKVSPTNVMDTISLVGEQWMPSNDPACGQKDDVKQRLKASLNKYIGYRKNKK